MGEGWSKVAQEDVEERERRGGGASSRDIAGALGAETTWPLRVWRYGPGHEMAYHRHGSQEEIYQLLSGGPQEVMVEGETVTVQDGDWLRFHQRHRRAASRTAPTARPSGSRSAPRPARASRTASASTPRPARRSPARDGGPVAMGARLLALAALIARRQGPKVAKALLMQGPGLAGRPGQRGDQAGPDRPAARGGREGRRGDRAHERRGSPARSRSGASRRPPGSAT